MDSKIRTESSRPRLRHVRVETYAYDGFDRLLKTTFPDLTTEQIGTTSQAGYDADDNILTRVNRAGEMLAYTYDNLDRMRTRALPAAQSIKSAIS